MRNPLLTPRWVLTTLLVIAAVAVMIWLGFWQLERLAWRQDLNRRITAQLNAPPLDLNGEIPVAQLSEMEYRMVQVTGVYDFEHEFLWRNQIWDNQPGYHLFTPLRIDGSDWVVFIDRGWIPLDRADAESRLQYRENGVVSLKGMIRRALPKPTIGGVADPPLGTTQQRPEAWNWVDLNRWQAETGLNLLPVWIQQTPQGAAVRLPYPSLPDIEITEGPHFGYALQWFAFAAILAIGYPFFVRKQLENRTELGKTNESADGIEIGEEIYEH